MRFNLYLCVGGCFVSSATPMDGADAESDFDYVDWPIQKCRRVNRKLNLNYSAAGERYFLNWIVVKMEFCLI